MKTEELKKFVSEAIINKYGSLDDFYKSEFAKKNKNLRSYLHPTGAMSLPVFKSLCEHLGLGSLERTVKVIRAVDFTLENVTTVTEDKRKCRKRQNKTH